MPKQLPRCSLLLLTIVLLSVLSSCSDHTAEIPFPGADSVFVQPVTTPLKLSAPKKLDWVTLKTGRIAPSIKKLDIDGLPSVPYEPNSFKTFPKPPEEIRFDFNALPDSAFDIDKIPSKKPKFKTYILAPPTFVKAAPISPKSGATPSIVNAEQSLGLRGRVFFSVMRDKKGFIWMSTERGIFRYDGEYVLNYSTTPARNLIFDKDDRLWYINAVGFGVIDTRTGLVSFSSAIRSPYPDLPKMILDTNGRIWVTRIESKGVAVIDPKTLTFKELDNHTGISGSDTWAVWEDGYKNIWVTSEGGANIINPGKGTIKHLKKINGLGSDTLMAITGDKKGRVLIAYKGGLSLVDIENGSIENYGKSQGLHNNFTFRLLRDGKDRVWMATNEGLAIVDLANKVFKYPTESEGFTSDYILDLCLDNQQRVWLGGYSTGLGMVDQDGEMVYPVGKKVVSTLFEDSASKIWVGSSSEGITILDGEKKTARHLDKAHGFTDDFIQSFYQKDGNIWVASDGGLDIIDQAHKILKHTGKKEGLLNDSIYSILTDRGGNLWITGPSAGIEFIDRDNTSIKSVSKETGLSDDDILSLKDDADGRIWVATYKGGVDIIDPRNGTVQYLTSAPGLDDACFRSVMPDNQGRTWIGTDKGVYIADLKNGTLTSIGIAEGMSNNYVNSLIQYGNSVIAGTHNKINIITPPSFTGDGLSKTEPGKWKVSLLAKSEGLATSTNSWDVNIITHDGKYLFGDAGVTIINGIKEEKRQPETYISGLTIMNQPRYFANRPLPPEPDTLWTADSFYVKGQKPINSGYIEPGKFQWDSVSGPYNMPENLRVPYDQNYMQFQFGQMHVGRQDSTFYSYLLEGIDKKWSNFTNKTVTDNYLNLSPGKYTFKVRSKYASGLWSKPAAFSFTILPPWWKTWWAYTIYILLLLAAVGGLLQYRSKRLLRENRILEERVTHRTEQLNKSLEDLKSTQSQLVQSEKMASLGELTAGIAHEIQNPLNFVNNFSEVNMELTEELKEELSKLNLSQAEKSSIEQIAEDIRNNQEKITYHGKRADSIVKGMLQHSRSSTGQKEPTNINALADEYLRLAYHGLRAKDKSFNATMKTDFDESIGKINIISQDFGRVILNLITNAFYSVTEKKKQNPDGYEPTVSVSTKKISNKVEVRIRDNGNGIPKKVMEKIFQPFFTTKPTGQGTGLGLSLSYDIIKVHGGELKVDTKENEFAEFTITLPQ